jgi:hypothetical protein
MTPGQLRLYSGDYNYLSQEWREDGTVIVTISGGRSGRVHRLRVRDLWGEREEVLEEEELVDVTPDAVVERLLEAWELENLEGPGGD